MDKPVLKDSMRLFEQLGRVKSRSMFGGFGIFVDETMFALVVNDTLHIRADDTPQSKSINSKVMNLMFTKNVASPL
ncbi:hypothetical protein VCSRO3_2602 [Vibrio cholerae]|nr:hypothetical protein VCSRO3_2602 [Vibrio cholerae]